MNRMGGLYSRRVRMNKALDRTAVIQDLLDNNGFYVIDAKAEEVAKGLGLLDVGLDRDVD